MPLPLVAPPVHDFRCAGSQYLNPMETGFVVALVHSIQPSVVAEFGCQNGATALAILSKVASVETYIGIDLPPGYRPMLDCQRTEVPSRPGFRALADPRFKLLLRDSRTLVAEELEECSAVFIDGDHSFKGVLHDSRLAHALVKRGIVIWHDYLNSAVEVTEVLDLLHDDEGWPIKAISGTWLAFMRMEASNADETA